MVRAPRRQIATEPPVTRPGTALKWELSDRWPSNAERLRFWNGSQIPADLRERNAPDPRPVLYGDESRLVFETDAALFRERRFEWLRQESRNG